ncbi:hypothetical protein FRUB_01536 [Fimbriiglobus ruber]|uniref:Uncharacterized protein n=1 Tax=Fimbriiglobus ruber TaxID=1908690 RepID=A0A225E9E3_9BACT|nr:hypothetical protein FRUB_01536 [Fimbriiglobus ruber]
MRKIILTRSHIQIMHTICPDNQPGDPLIDSSHFNNLI